jgi:hypothetical protein
MRRIAVKFVKPPLSSTQAGEFDHENFVERVHTGDAVARCAYEVFRMHGSASELELEEDWNQSEAARLDRYVSGRRAA